MAVGVISHLHNISLDGARSLARAAEEAGADWVGVPDAFWWRDAWMLLGEAARVTQRIEIGPMVTNPYLRHPFHTVAAVATLQDLAGSRVFVGLAAGGSEVSGAAGIPRHDAPSRLLALADLLRGVASGQPLDPASGRTLEVPLSVPPILVAGRGDGVLRAAGRCADRALLWAVPDSDLDRSAAVVESGGREDRQAPGDRPEIVWAPLVDHGGQSRAFVRSTAAYSVLNSSSALQARWGLDRGAVDKLRRRLVASGAASAADLVPVAAIEDLIVSDPDPATVGAMARRIGATSMALPAFSIEGLGERVAWARAVLAAASDGGAA
jgi:5,10-methylenetetrahydromethanopterin reductase